MVKKAKVGRPKKKRKYTRRIKENDNFNLKSTEQDSNENSALKQKPSEVRRASETTSIFIDGNRVYVRNLNDQSLVNNSNGVYNKIEELRRQFNSFETLYWEMTKEKEYRKL